MKKKFITCLVLFAALGGFFNAWAGSETTNKNFYKPDYRSTQRSEYNSFNDYLDDIDERLGINVLSYGADPTGVLDSTTAIQAAIDAAEADWTTIFLPEGTYKITSALTINNPIVLKGSGWYSNTAASSLSGTIIKNDGTANDAIVISGNSTTMGTILKDFMVEGAGAGATSGHGIHLSGLESSGSIANVTLDNVASVKNKDDGIRVAGVSFLCQWWNIWSINNGDYGLNFQAVGAGVPGQFRIHGGLFNANGNSSVLVAAGGGYDFFGCSFSGAATLGWGLEATAGYGRVFGGKTETNTANGDFRLASTQPWNIYGTETGIIKISSHANVIAGTDFATDITIDAGKTGNILINNNLGGGGSITDNGTNTLVLNGSVHNTVQIQPLSHNGQHLDIKETNTELTGLSGATATWTNAIPDGSLVLGVGARVTTLVTGATSIDIGDGTDADIFIDGMDVVLNTTAELTDCNDGTLLPRVYNATTSIVLTAIGPNFTAGAVRLSLYYIDLTPPTS